MRVKDYKERISKRKFLKTPLPFRAYCTVHTTPALGIKEKVFLHLHLPISWVAAAAAAAAAAAVSKEKEGQKEEVGDSKKSDLLSSSSLVD